MLFRNRELERAFDFISHSDFDIFCLQEVPEKFLARLKTLPVAVAAVPETDRFFKKERSTQYGVILSRYPLRTFEAIPFPLRERDLPWRGKLFTRLMFALQLWTQGLGNRHAMYADAETPIGIVRVLNVHLLLLTPASRSEEFEHAMTERDAALPTIVCGDFNILDAPHIALLNWLLGGGIRDALFYRRERTRIEERFAAHDVRNVLRGNVTHPLSHSQLDHILVSRAFRVQNASVLPDRVGSDHHPICAELS
ncbi:MAG: endonuclease/exonuclease/phosphatase family protein [Minisyncoccota bacterium]